MGGGSFPMKTESEISSKCDTLRTDLSAAVVEVYSAGMRIK